MSHMLNSITSQRETERIHSRVVAIKVPTHTDNLHRDR